jgi:cystathionine beta-lyase
MSSNNKAQLRREFLANCTETTRAIHLPIIDPAVHEGHLNPAGLGNAREFSNTSFGQSSVTFETLQEYHAADTARKTPYDTGAAEYGIVSTPDSVRVANKFAELHGGAGAVVLPSGLAAISSIFLTFLKDNGKGAGPAVLIPDNRYFPAERVLTTLQEHNRRLKIYRYPSGANAKAIEKILYKTKKDNRSASLLYLEVPGSQTFEVIDLIGILNFAKKHKIKTAIDNTWGSHVRVKPINLGADIVIQATTKYEGGYADTPSGIVVAKKIKDATELAKTCRHYGIGTVSPQTCRRLFNRVASTEQRMDQHYKSALEIIEWFKNQSFVDDILAPYLPHSPSHTRFNQIFSGGNGLFTVRFNAEANPEKLDKFIDNLLLFRIAESWGGHVSLVLPVEPSRKLTKLPEGKMLRFSTGLEDPRDLINDLKQASLALLR